MPLRDPQPVEVVPETASHLAFILLALDKDLYPVSLDGCQTPTRFIGAFGFHLLSLGTHATVSPF